MSTERTLTKAEQDVLAERAKQRVKWGDKHDDEHTSGDLAHTAGCLSLGINDPWHLGLRHDRRERLVIASALLIAEIERVDRAALNITIADGRQA